MIIEEGTEIGQKTIIMAGDGRRLMKVKQFDTETKEATLYAMCVYDDKSKKPAIIGKCLNNGERDIVTFTCHLLGHKAYGNNAPKDFECIWQKEISQRMNNNADTSKTNEKLFVYCG